MRWFALRPWSFLAGPIEIGGCVRSAACGPDRLAALAFSRLAAGRRRHDLSFHRQSDRSEEHTSELQSRQYLVCRLLLEKKNHGASQSGIWIKGTFGTEPA